MEQRASRFFIVAQDSRLKSSRSSFSADRTQVQTGRWVFLFVCFSSILGCEDTDPKKAPPTQTRPPVAQEKKPERLFLPDPGASQDVVDLKAPDANVTDSVTFGPGSTPSLAIQRSGRCPEDMVDVAGAFCIDRFEASLVDAKSGRELSPHYPAEKGRSTALFSLWSKKASRSRMALGRQIPVPAPPSFQLTEDFAPRALSLRGRVPAGYLSRGTAETACQNAGKRLCSRQEWVRACRGEGNTKFPYGSEYRQGTCNVHRQSHPAALLHGNSSENHLDPRLGLTYDDDGPLLLSTGDNTECVSKWGTDAIYDMVGNLDEWIEEPSGSFVGGFFSRATREGCDASIDSHDPGYLDYSLGTRCCKDQL